MAKKRRKAKFRVGERVWCRICKVYVKILGNLANGQYTTTCEPKATGGFGVNAYELAARAPRTKAR